MAKLTLLEIVQDILNDMDGDEVDTITETIESAQVAQIVKTSYFELMASRNWPHLKTAFRLTDLSDNSTPTIFMLTELFKELEWFRYNCRSSTDTRDKWRDIIYKDPKDFVSIVNSRDSSASNVIIMSEITGSIDLYIQNDKAPQYWTSFDDEYIICDSYDSAVDALCLSGLKTSCYGVKSPVWSHADGAVPDLPEEAFPVLIEEAKSTAFYALRQVANEKAEQKATRQSRWLARKAWRTKGGVRYPNYGRKKAFTGYEKNPLLDKG